MSTRGLNWFKSSYSGTDGDSCLEVALTWHKSSHSGGDGDSCVEVAECPEAIHVRDSKDTTLPHLTLTPHTWAAFTTYARSQA
ncbi:DUF397 domain-containing protein [Streptomyces iconiensis]|uniref:DUF397 domain-containing protein n=1 Tax=Streptomyces iconiensis TaxID=1384038 RepID=A0ABT6ZYL3_9ACTN|nr:DUF397 domain-containing protein [Streptomyces iconiensis]MDJ1133899.1 DUF397 domain-containing protein [Streptomyces iconiensis]